MNSLPSITQLDLPPRPASRFSAGPIDSPRPQPARPLPAMAHALQQQQQQQQHHHSSTKFAQQRPAGLPTPPNSNPLPPYHSFHGVHDDDGEHDGLLFPPHQPHSPSSSPRLLAVATLPTPPRVEMRPLGYSYDRMLLDKIDSHARSTQAYFDDKGIQPPSRDDYNLSLDFDRNFKRAFLDATSPTGPQPASPMLKSRSSPGRARPRKVLRDSTPNRRAVTPLSYQQAAATVADEPETAAVALTAHRRRRSSTNASGRRRANPKPVAGGKEAKSARAKSTKVQKSDNYLDYPDFAPSFGAMRRPMELAQKAKDYGTHPLDMTADPLRHLMHEAEIELAQRLHLNGAKYLCVKRQLFEEYVKLLRHESDKQANWNKTAAQRVSNVDVTKTSVVWQFYNDIGWFERSLFDHWTDASRDLSGEYYPRRAGIA